MHPVGIDPKLSPAQNLEAYFKRAKKAAKREQRAQQDEDVMAERVGAIEALAASGALVPLGVGRREGISLTHPNLPPVVCDPKTKESGPESRCFAEAWRALRLGGSIVR